MKKALLVVLIALVSVSMVAAKSFEGTTTVGLNYEYREGLNLGGLSTASFGTFENSPIGYLFSISAAANFADAKDFSISLLAAPKYSYYFSNVPMSIDAALGLSFTGNLFDDKTFGFGFGGYIGATYNLNDMIALLLGCTLGYDIMSVDLDNGNIDSACNFYVVPSLSIGFRY